MRAFLRRKASLEDVNDDGLLDLLVHVRTQDLLLDATEADVDVRLTGETFDGQAIEGVDRVLVLR